MEHYIRHALSEVNSRRNDGWVDEHYRTELVECGKVIDDYLKTLNEQLDMFSGISKNHEKERLIELRKKIDEVQRPQYSR